MNKFSPNLSQITIDQLEKTSAICQDITKNKVVEKESIKNNLIYLFSWNNLDERENNYKFTRYVKNNLKEIYLSQLSIEPHRSL